MSREPVLLLHGIDDTAEVFYKMKPALQKAGFTVYEYNFIPNNGSVGLDILAGNLKAYITKIVNNQKLHIVAFSMGGIIARYYLQELDGIKQTNTFISIASPHFGTWTAYFRRNSGVSQLRPNSSFLNRLNKNSNVLKKIHSYTISTPVDLMIIPASSSILFNETHTYIFSLLHPWLLIDAKCISKVISLLNGSE
jgi:triacylglycerol lipase